MRHPVIPRRKPVLTIAPLYMNRLNSAAGPIVPDSVSSTSAPRLLATGAIPPQPQPSSTIPSPISSSASTVSTSTQRQELPIILPAPFYQASPTRPHLIEKPGIRIGHPPLAGFPQARLHDGSTEPQLPPQTIFVTPEKNATSPPLFNRRASLSTDMSLESPHQVDYSTLSTPERPIPSEQPTPMCQQTPTSSPDVARARRSFPTPGSSPGLLSQSLFSVSPVNQPQSKCSSADPGLLSQDLFPGRRDKTPLLARVPRRYRERQLVRGRNQSLRHYFEIEADESDIEEFDLSASDDSELEPDDPTNLPGFVVDDEEVTSDDDIQEFVSPYIPPFYLRSLSSQHAAHLGFVDNRPRPKGFVIPQIFKDAEPDHSDPIVFTGQEY